MVVTQKYIYTYIYILQKEISLPMSREIIQEQKEYIEITINNTTRLYIRKLQCEKSCLLFRNMSLG